MEGGLRRDSSSDMINIAQIYVPTMKVTFIKAPVIGTCLMNIPEGREPKNI